jgi:hypothetical protein
VPCKSQHNSSHCYKWLFLFQILSTSGADSKRTTRKTKPCLFCLLAVGLITVCMSLGAIVIRFWPWAWRHVQHEVFLMNLLHIGALAHATEMSVLHCCGCKFAVIGDHHSDTQQPSVILYHFLSPNLPLNSCHKCFSTSDQVAKDCNSLQVELLSTCLKHVGVALMNQ